MWIQLLHIAGLKDLDTLNLDKLGDNSLNGREIKNIVKLSVAKSKGLNVQLSSNMIEEEINS